MNAFHVCARCAGEYAQLIDLWRSGSVDSSYEGGVRPLESCCHVLGITRQTLHNRVSERVRIAAECFLAVCAFLPESKWAQHQCPVCGVMRPKPLW